MVNNKSKLNYVDCRIKNINFFKDDDQFGQDFMGEARLELSQIALPASVQISLEEHYPVSIEYN